MPPQLSVIIPAYNEECRLGATLDRLTAYLDERGLEHEILVVDDGSTDGTADVVRSYPAAAVRLVEQGTNRGKGAALRRGVAESRGRRVLLCDADLSTPIEELEALEARLDDGVAVAVASRAAPDSVIRRRQPLYRELMGKTFNLIVRLLAIRGIADTQCGFKLLDGQVARRLVPAVATDRFAFDVELLWLARRAEHRIDEVGVTWIDSPDSRVHPVFDAAGMLRDVIRMRWRHRRHRGSS
ncbi:MAG: dolichyl-phosphate beta-glucosyltransferase [Thermoanaerobaculia bacterium]